MRVRAIGTTQSEQTGKTGQEYGRVWKNMGQYALGVMCILVLCVYACVYIYGQYVYICRLSGACGGAVFFCGGIKNNRGGERLFKKGIDLNIDL